MKLELPDMGNLIFKIECTFIKNNNIGNFKFTIKIILLKLIFQLNKCQSFIKSFSHIFISLMLFVSYEHIKF